MYRSHFYVFFNCFIIIAVVYVASISSEQTAENTTLELVAILHRHGLRTPLETYVTDPYQRDAWPVTWGQLLKKGKQQLYNLGKTFHERYKSHVNKYTSESVKVRTSDIDRCHMSVASMLAAWFPPEDEEELWNKDIAWQPIPIHSVPKIEDNMLAQEKPCPRHHLELKKIDDEIKQNETKFDKHFYKYLSAEMGQKISDIHIIETLYGTIWIEELYGYNLPEFLKHVYPGEMAKRTKLSFATYSWTKLMRRLQGGPFIKELWEQFDKKSKGKSNDLKLLIYSAHDSTLFSVWRALEFEELIIPDFGSSFIFELHRTSNNDYIVKMFYMKNTHETQPIELQLPHCSSPCSLSTFDDVTRDVRPIDWNKECSI